MRAHSAHHALVIAQHRARLEGLVERAAKLAAGLDVLIQPSAARPSVESFLSAGITDRPIRFRNLPIGQKRNSQFSSVTLASRIDPNFARIARNLPQPKFRKTLRETLAQGKQ